jgi:hypothetical protein
MSHKWPLFPFILPSLLLYHIIISSRLNINSFQLLFVHNHWCCINLLSVIGIRVAKIWKLLLVIWYIWKIEVLWKPPYTTRCSVSRHSFLFFLSALHITIMNGYSTSCVALHGLCIYVYASFLCYMCICVCVCNFYHLRITFHHLIASSSVYHSAILYPFHECWL